jgi:SAM-dependent methyltransferase
VDVVEQRLLFGSIAELYDRTRPSYPAALVDDVLAFCGVERPRVLDVGAGTGRATVLFAPRAMSVLAIEPSAEMAAIGRRNCAPFGDGVSFELADFERWEPGDRRFDLLISGQAWHWVAPGVRTERARAVLATGGAVGLFWNTQQWRRSELFEPVRAVYHEIVPGFRATPGERPHSGAVWGEHARELDATPGFAAPEYRTYQWTATVTTAQYIDVTRTQSDHIGLERGVRDRLLAAVGKVIDEAGGSFTLPFESQLWLARAL